MTCIYRLFTSFKIAKNLSCHQSAAMAHSGQYKYHIMGTSYVNTGTTTTKTCTTYSKKWNNSCENLYHFSKHLSPHFQKLVPLGQIPCTTFTKPCITFLITRTTFSKLLYYLSKTGTTFLRPCTTFPNTCITFLKTCTTFPKLVPLF